MEKKRKDIIVTVIGRDEVGIVARIATALAESKINIIDINQSILGGGGIFAMTLLADRADSGLSMPEITGRLKDSVQDLSLKVTVQDAEVFQYMQRI
jgi:ACT domain-containing protein